MLRKPRKTLNILECGFCIAVLELSPALGLGENRGILWIGDRIGRARSLFERRRSDRKDEELAGGPTDGVQVVMIVP